MGLVVWHPSQQWKGLEDWTVSLDAWVLPRSGTGERAGSPDPWVLFSFGRA